MPVCVAAVESGPGTGLYYLTLDPTRTDTSTCSYLIEDGASNAWRELGNMSIENAQVIGMAIGGVWAAAFGFKLLIRALRSDEPATDS
jgi:hypothetical protein